MSPWIITRRQQYFEHARSLAVERGATWLAQTLSAAGARTLSDLPTTALAAIARDAPVEYRPRPRPRWYPAAAVAGVLLVAAGADFGNVFSMWIPHLVRVAAAATLGR